MVTVKYEVTTGAGEDSIGKSELLSMTALRAILRSIAGIHCHKFSTSTFSLVGKTSNELAPASIGNGLSQAVIMQHTVGIDVFHTDHPKLAHNLMRKLVGKVRPSVSDAFMDMGYNLLGFSSFRCSLVQLRQLPLSLSQSLLASPEEARIGNSFASRERSKGFQTNINPNGFFGLWQRAIRYFSGQTDKPFTSRRSLNGTGANISCCPMNDSLDIPNLGESDAIILKRESKLRIGKAIIPTSAFETGIAWLLTCFYSSKERFESKVNPHSHILKDLGVDIGKALSSLFQLGYRNCLGVVIQGFLFLFPSVLAFLKQVVVEPVTLIQCRLHQMFLVRSRIEAILEGFKHQLYYSLIEDSIQGEDSGLSSAT